MNESQKETTVSARSIQKTCAGLLSTLGDVGLTWATYGLKVGKLALETSAETLGRTAKALDTLGAELAKKPTDDKPVEAAPANDEKPAAPEANAAPAA
ncbi:MAG: hypothetical protein U0359_06475 [Byssovorax sp.]